MYVGAAPNQHVVPLVRHMLDHISSDVFCIGSNYVWTWEMNRVIREIVTSAGGRILAERLLELGETTVDHIVKEIIDRKPPVVFNTLVGESSYAFMHARRAAANHRYDSPQGPVWVDPDNNHCFLTPRLARSAPGSQFNIFWEADAPERPDPYLSNLDLAAIGTRPELGHDAATRRSNHLRIVK